jgi:hypothetical protein
MKSAQIINIKVSACFTFCMVFLSALFISSPVFADDISDGKTREYQVVYLEEKKDDTIKINAEVEEIIGYSGSLTLSELNGEPVYKMDRVERTAQGDEHIWEIYMDAENMGLMRIQKKTVSRSGNVVREQWINYKDPMFDYPDNLCHVYTITAAIRKMELKVGARNDIHLLLDVDSAPWHMYVVVEDIETIKVPAGEFECYKIKLDPDYKSIMGSWSWASPVIKRFVPDYYFWVDVNEPHTLVRFQGTFGPVGGSPSQAHELVSPPVVSK